MAAAMPVHAARVGVLSNKYATETAADFNARIPTHDVHADRHVGVGADAAVADQRIRRRAGVRGFDVRQCDRGRQCARRVRQCRVAPSSSARSTTRTAPTVPPSNSPHGWGALEQIDPNTTDGTGTPYAPRTLDTATMLRHALTTGITSLTSAKFAGGNQAKPGTTRRRLLEATQRAGSARSRHRLPDHGCGLRDPRGHCAELSGRSASPAPISAATSTAPGRTRSTSAPTDVSPRPAIRRRRIRRRSRRCRHGDWR